MALSGSSGSGFTLESYLALNAVQLFIAGVLTNILPVFWDAPLVRDELERASYFPECAFVMHFFCPPINFIIS